MTDLDFFRSKKTLVTGGSGFVGSHIVEALLERDASVRITLHKNSSRITDKRIESVPADLASLDDCRKAVRGAQCVFHAAGVVFGAGAGTAAVMGGITQNLILTARMLHAAWLEGAERFLVFSSSTAYPAADHPMKEDELWSAPPFQGYFGYGWMRRYIERLSEYVASKSSLQIALVRPTAVYGRWDNFDPAAGHVIPALIRRAVAKENPFVIWGTGNEVRDFLHVKDLALGCLLMLAKHAKCDPVNIGYGQGVTIREVATAILKAAGHDQAQVQFDATKPSAIPIRRVDTGKADKLLGFRPQISLEAGVTDTVEWFQSQAQNK